jgi:Methylamine utilisation protein MauE
MARPLPADRPALAPGGGATLRLAGEAARWLLVLAFAATALGKLLDLPGFAGVLAGYRLIPAPLLLPLAFSLVAAEAAIAMGLAWRTTLPWAAAGAIALALGNAAVLTLTLARGIALDNCGWFGVFLARPPRPWTPLEDLLLAGLAFLALCAARTGGRRRAA